MNTIEIQKSIRYAIGNAIPWRIGVQAKFPEDPRNPLAVDLLKQFATDVEHMTPGQLEMLAPYFSWLDEHWHTTVRNVVRRVGYERRIKSFDSFVTALVSYLQHAKAVA